VSFGSSAATSSKGMSVMLFMNVLIFSQRPSIVLRASVMMLKSLTTVDLVSFSDMLPVLMTFIVPS
jgi:hypothetical protein